MGRAAADGGVREAAPRPGLVPRPGLPHARPAAVPGESWMMKGASVVAIRQTNGDFERGNMRSHGRNKLIHKT